MYLDAIYFGDGHWGIVQASEGYFGKLPQRLDWAQASLLAGLVQAPSADDPRVHLAAALRRQRHVLDRLVAAGVLGRAEAAAASHKTVEANLTRIYRKLGIRSRAELGVRLAEHRGLPGGQRNGT